MAIVSPYQSPSPQETIPYEGRRLFGTSGIRGVVGKDLSLDLCRRAGQAIGTRLSAHARVCVATDTRLSREAVKAAVTTGLRAAGIEITDLGILPTPALAALTRQLGFDTGIMLTASHNPPEYNGIKLFNGDAIGYDSDQEAEIETIYNQGLFRNGREGSFSFYPEASKTYGRFIEDTFPAGSLRRRRIVVDPGNGAASGLAGELLAAAGLEVITINDEPDGSFPGRNPEPRSDTLQDTVTFLRERGAEMAVCFDGDADRVVFCDREGFIGHNEVVAFMARLAVAKNGRRKVTATVETGRILDRAVADLGGEVVRGRVGDVPVAYLAREHDAAIGVEPIGVYIMPEAGYYPDSIYAALTLLSRIEAAEDIRNYLNQLPQSCCQQHKLACPNHLKVLVMERLAEKVSEFNARELNTLDGLRFEFDEAWLLIRASGTEPAVRVIAEAGSTSQSSDLLARGVRAVAGVLKELPL